MRIDFFRLLPLVALLSTTAAIKAEEKLELPEILADETGRKAENANEWREKVRPRTLDLFREHVYGRSPLRDPSVAEWKITDLPDAPAGLKVSDGDYRFTGPGGEGRIKVRIVLPAAAEKPVPFFLLINNRSPELSDLGTANGFWPAEAIAKRGYGTAIFHIADVDPDKAEDFKDGVHAIFDRGKRKPDSWGTIAAWSWGASRIVSVLRETPGIDPERIAVVGHSRGGKAALWCGAQDERVGLTISNESGCTGAALSRRIHGETIADINKSFPHWFCENYKRYNGKEAELPVDQHQLIGLLAPRLAYVASAAEDDWADPKGEFLSCVHAAPAYRLFDLPGLTGEAMPEVGGRLHEGRIGYHIRPGKHDLTAEDWSLFMDFADRHWKR